MNKVYSYDILDNKSGLTPLYIRYTRINNVISEVSVGKMFEEEYEGSISYGLKEGVLKELDSLIDSLKTARDNIATTE